MLKLSGFRDQQDLLDFARALENAHVLAEVSLTRAVPTDAWFAVRATSAQQVVAALQEIRGWLISASASDVVVEGRVESVRAESEHEESAALIPQRTRFRVFGQRRGPLTPPSHATPPTTAPAIPAHTTPLPAPERFVQPSQPAVPAATTSDLTADSSVATTPAPGVASNPIRQSDMIAVDDRPGGAVPLAEHLTLIVYPFHSFVALNEFQSAVRALRGMTNTRVRRFYRGTLHLAVDYEDIIPLAERLRDLRGFRWQLVSEGRQELELLLEDAAPLLAAEGDG